MTTETARIEAFSDDVFAIAITLWFSKSACPIPMHHPVWSCNSLASGRLTWPFQSASCLSESCRSTIIVCYPYQKIRQHSFGSESAAPSVAHRALRLLSLSICPMLRTHCRDPL